MVECLSPKAESLVDNYLHIKVGPYVTPAPYYMNILSKRFSAPVWVGKGLPGEIEIEANKIYRKFKPYFEDSPSQGHSLLVNAGLGVDCSGLVNNVLDAHLRETKGFGLVDAIGTGVGLKWLSKRLRPRTSISANDLTNDLNSVLVKRSEVIPGDLIRKGRYHVLLVEKVAKKNSQIEITYIESATRPFHGVQRIVTIDDKLEYRRLKKLHEKN